MAKSLNEIINDLIAENEKLRNTVVQEKKNNLWLNRQLRKWCPFSLSMPKIRDDRSTTS